jgi:mono/diheme cytochrome c family protein
VRSRLKCWMILSLTATVTALPAIAQDNATLPDGPGKAVVQKMCVGCHGLSVIAAKHATPEQWANIVQQMVSRGADGTDEEIETVTRYLSASFPPLDKDKPAAPPSPPPSLTRVQNLNSRFYIPLQ